MKGYGGRILFVDVAGSHHDTRPTPRYAQGYDRRGTDAVPPKARLSVLSL